MQNVSDSAKETFSKLWLYRVGRKNVRFQQKTGQAYLENGER